MTPSIQHFRHARRLILAWQGPMISDRYRWAVGILEKPGETAMLRYFGDGAEFERFNSGRRFAGLAEAGYSGYPAFNSKALEHRHGVLDAFMRRLPPRNRPDFDRYAAQFCLSGIPFADFDLLGLTGAKLPSDGFSIVDPLDGAGTIYDVVIEVAGHRFHDGVGLLKPGDRLTFEADADNAHDPLAVRVAAGGRTAGYVNRLQAETFHRWLSHAQLDGIVLRVNGEPTAPRVFAFVQVRPSVRDAA